MFEIDVDDLFNEGLNGHLLRLQALNVEDNGNERSGQNGFMEAK